MIGPAKASRPERPWTVPLSVHEVPLTGRHFEIAADETVRTAIAESAGVRALPRLEAVFDVSRRGDRLHVAGRVSATVGQLCVVTLEPVDSAVEEAVDLLFVAAAPAAAESSGKGVVEVSAEDGPEIEALVNDTVDLGAIATEFLLLGIDPYPRKPGAKFDAPARDDPSAHPFAALASLRKEHGGHER